MRNCPNCGAPLEPYKCRCEYCGTWYFDLTAFDMSGNDPYYVKFRTPYGVITTLAKPELREIEMTEDYCDATNAAGNKLIRLARNRQADLNVVFHAVMDYDGRLLTLDTNV